MRTFQHMAAQGDLLLRRVDTLPDAAEPVDPTGNRHIIAHSETGHHHYIDADAVIRWDVPDDPMICYLRVAGDHADVVHDRPWDTHETIRLAPGTYEVRRQREHTPEGWRRVED